MVYFDESGVILGQLSGHYNMHEIYTNIYSSFFLFFASLIAIAIVHSCLRKTVYSWPAILWGLFYSGLIGLGEGAEHFPFLELPIRSMLHYLHLLSANVAVFALYIGMKDTVAISRKGSMKPRKHSNIIIAGAFAATLLGVIIMAYFSPEPWDPRIENPFLLMRFQPTLVLVGLVIWESRHFSESIEMLYLTILSIIISLLMLDIWLGRYADNNGMAGLYILTHSLQNILLVLSGGVVLVFALNVWYSRRIDKLFVLGVPKKRKSKR
jgi:hypothetical protein